VGLMILELSQSLLILIELVELTFNSKLRSTDNFISELNQIAVLPGTIYDNLGYKAKAFAINWRNVIGYLANASDHISHLYTNVTSTKTFNIMLTINLVRCFVFKLQTKFKKFSREGSYVRNYIMIIIMIMIASIS